MEAVSLNEPSSVSSPSTSTFNALPRSSDARSLLDRDSLCAPGPGAPPSTGVGDQWEELFFCKQDFPGSRSPNGLQGSRERDGEGHCLCFFVRHEMGDASNQHLRAKETHGAKRKGSAPLLSGGKTSMGKPWSKKQAQRGDCAEWGRDARKRPGVPTSEPGDEVTDPTGTGSGALEAQRGDTRKEFLTSVAPLMDCRPKGEQEASCGATSPQLAASCLQNTVDNVSEADPAVSVSSPQSTPTVSCKPLSDLSASPAVSSPASSSFSSSLACVSSSSLSYPLRALPLKSVCGAQDKEGLVTSAPRIRFSLVYLHSHPDGVVASLSQLCASACTASDVLRALWSEHSSERQGEEVETGEPGAGSGRVSEEVCVLPEGESTVNEAEKNAETGSVVFPVLRNGPEDSAEEADALRRSMEAIGAITPEASARLAGQPVAVWAPTIHTMMEGYVEKRYLFPPVDLQVKKEETHTRLSTRYADGGGEGSRSLASVPLTLTEHYVFRQFNGLMVVGLSARGLFSASSACAASAQTRGSPIQLHASGSPSPPCSASVPLVSSQSWSPCESGGRDSRWRRLRLTLRDGVSRNCVSGKRKKGAFFLQADTLVAVLSFEEKIPFSEDRQSRTEGPGETEAPARVTLETAGAEAARESTDAIEEAALHASTKGLENREGSTKTSEDGQSKPLGVGGFSRGDDTVSVFPASPILEHNVTRKREEAHEEVETRTGQKKRGRGRRRKRCFAESVVLPGCAESAVTKRAREEGEDEKSTLMDSTQNEEANAETDDDGRRWQWIPRRIPVYACTRGMLLEFNSAVLERPELLLSQPEQDGWLLILQLAKRDKMQSFSSRSPLRA
ncbi:hypothetical protein TGGT1_253310 [Toxoplasma gondii GT1]|uniref:Uncharacterized protein n=3 Tax=Toxoplasma gondii TaxID=5811 RepID=S7UMI7_TOXGG|nr:hypothetical protein TGGT1_253310 [Toxoplasma gondii GT1]KAF4645397.1 hypothetical protein TGRH88_005010 [Toxoplasma gondii]KFG52907.1 hypothetical protein TGFOU_253310 [Toxoplasma gondii FOU]